MKGPRCAQNLGLPVPAEPLCHGQKATRGDGDAIKHATEIAFATTHPSAPLRRSAGRVKKGSFDATVLCTAFVARCCR